MKNPIVQVQARLGSTRLPGKVLFHLGKYRVIEWVLNRCQAAECPEGVAVTTGNRPENAALIEWCERNQVTYRRGPEDNLLQRHRQLANAVNADPIVRVTGDCPFVPPQEIDRILKEHAKNEARYTTNVVNGMPVGTAVDVIERDILDELADFGDTHPVARLRESPENWDVSFSDSSEFTEFGRAHTAVDTPDDYWALIDAIEAVGTDPIKITSWVAEHY